MTLSAEQISMRRTLVGASEVAAVLGLQGFFDDATVWLRKQPIPDDGPIPDEPSFAMEMGNALEPIIIARWAKENGRSVIDSRHPDFPGTKRHPKYPHVGATPDGLVVGVREGLEAKFSSQFGLVFEEDELPDPYFVQCQINADTFDMDVWNWAALVNNKWITGRVERDRELCRTWCEKVETWWERYVVGNVSPEPKGGASMKALLSHRFPRSMEHMLPAMPIDVALRDELVAAKVALASAEEHVEQLEVALKRRIGDAAGIAGCATWKTDAVGRTSWAEVARAMSPPASLVAKYTSAPTRRFLVKKPKGA